MIVSHDRYFMDRLVDHLFVFEGNGEVRDFPGNYTQYRIWMKEQEEREGLTVDSRQLKVERTEVKNDIVASKKKMSFKEKREFEMLEKELPALEAEKLKITEKMSQGDLSFDEISKLSERMIAITQELEEKELRWLELSEMV